MSSPNHSPPVAVCELITADHSVLSLSMFLETFRYSEGALYGFSKVVTPRHIVIDRSLVLLLSFLKVYNCETLSEYLSRCFDLVTGCSIDPEAAWRKAMLHACKSHCIEKHEA